MSVPSFLLPSSRTETVGGHEYRIRELTAADMAHISTLDPQDRGYEIVAAAVSMTGEDLGNPREWAARHFQPLLRAALKVNGMNPDGDEEEEAPEVGNAHVPRKKAS